jgi:hypothetical protein
MDHPSDHEQLLRRLEDKDVHGTLEAFFHEKVPDATAETLTLITLKRARDRIGEFTEGHSVVPNSQEVIDWLMTLAHDVSEIHKRAALAYQAVKDILLSPDFDIVCDSSLQPHQLIGALTALADFYRACGGLGFQIDFELQDVYVREPEHVLG